MKLFEVHDLRYRVGDKVLIELDHLAIDGQELNLVLGANGSGKTTLLRCLAGLLAAEGRILFKGKSLATYSPIERARAIGWVPSQLQLGFEMSVSELVQLGRYPWHEGYPRAHDRAQVTTSLEQLGIASLAHRSLATLSSGESQKVQIARALACEVECLILDEPCAHLDVGARYEMMRILKGLVSQGKTVLMSSHDLYLAPRFSSRFLSLRAGRVIAYQAEQPGRGALRQLYSIDEELGDDFLDE